MGDGAILRGEWAWDFWGSGLACEGLTGCRIEDGVDLEEPAGGGVAEGGFEVPEIEAVAAMSADICGHEGFALIEREEGHLQLHGEGLGEDSGWLRRGPEVRSPGRRA